MSKKLQKSLNDYLSKIKIKNRHVHIPTKAIKASTKRILSGCKHPKTSSFAVDQRITHVPEAHAATLSDIDRFLAENFSSLYCNDRNDSEDDEKKDEDDAQKLNVFLFESPKFIGPVPEICASNRFFISPRTSSSLVEETRSSVSTLGDVQSSTTTATNTATSFTDSMRSSTEIKGFPLPDESVSVLICSPDPYSDFRRSMKEMVEARLNQNQSIDWDYMQELLFCYLRLNEEKSYKYILSAFVDLTASLRQNNHKNPTVHRRTKGDRRMLRRDNVEE